MVTVPTLPGAELPIPPAFERLYDLAYNLWWTWDPVAGDLWRALDRQLWTRHRNPIEVLRNMAPSQWEALLDSESFNDVYSEAVHRFDTYMASEGTWWTRHHADANGPIAYLCTEYGLDPTIPIYSGGLGILAGDHTRSASDLGVPFVGVGLFYRRGYFRQEIDAEGNQQHTYPTLVPDELPIRPVAGPTGGQLKVGIEFPGRTVHAAVWCLQVGRVPLLLLDTDIEENTAADRPITHILYVRGREMRFCQELVLGVGGVRALRALDVDPAVWHVNEGHAALSLIERVAEEVEGGRTLAEAEQRVKASTLFTLHTPVPAGNEVFDFHLAEKYLAPWPARLGTDLSYLSRMGAGAHGEEGRFDLGALAIRLAAIVNGVSKRHAEIVTRDWGALIGGPAEAITNGVHTPTWVSRPIGRRFVSIADREWPDRLVEEPELWSKVHDLDDVHLWRDHMARKTLLTNFARGRLRRQLARHGASPDELRAVDTMLPPERLTIGFARRFATYKRALLVFHNLPWLQAILTNPDRPVQIIFAGKAHPADREGQALIRQIFEFSRMPELRGHVVILEDYDMRMARFLVQGVDLWLNNPRPPMEASGTSGMKAAINGGLNVSTPDGWWLEGFNGKNGWTFGSAEPNGDHGAQDNEDAVALYRLLQDEIVPLFYDRDHDDVPRGWVARMKESIASITPAFSTHRMVAEYANKAYVPLGR